MEFIHIFPMDSPTHNTHTKEIDVLAGGKKNQEENKKRDSNCLSNALQCHLQVQKPLSSYLMQVLASAVHL